MPNLNFLLKIRHILIGTLLLMTGVISSYAFPADFYTPKSRLSEGTWAKIEVSETGMQFISDATLRQLGFSDPAKVNIYGYGGVVIPETLDSPDDLPLVPSLRVEGGLIFFGKGFVGWERYKDMNREYRHLSHPYSDKSYYFVSDFQGENVEPEFSDEISGNGATLTTFTQRLLHEQELTMPIETGRLVLGEDFKTQASRNFQFDLPGNTGDAVVTVAFGNKTNSGTPTLTLSANGEILTATTSDRMPYSSSKLIVTTTTVKEVEKPGERLDLNIRFNGSGTVSVAGLDYIEVEYPRTLAITDGELYFNLAPETASEVRISGAEASTQVWDVTDITNIVKMPTHLEGDVLTFNTTAGEREFVAFNPGSVKRVAKAAEKVANQDLHSLAAPDMLVICPQEYLYAARNLASLHQATDGLQLLILTPEEIYNEFSSGKPDVSAFRKLLKMWYDRAGGIAGEYPAYCLIMSRPTFDNKMLTPVVRNAGYPRVPIYQSATGDTNSTSYSTDDYIGMLKDVKGTFSIGSAEINVAVGRMPVKSLNEANQMIEKLETYLKDPDLGNWRNNVMVIADDQDNGVHLQQAEDAITAMKGSGKGKDFLYEKLYLDAYEMKSGGTGNKYPEAHERMMKKWDEGTALINYIGHANATSWGHESLLTWTDINAMNNRRLPYIYAATCEFMRWDENNVSGGEILWLLPSAGIIGMICPTREVLITSNGVLNKATSKFMFETDADGLPLSLGEVMRLGKNASNTGTNKLRYSLIGDPSIRLPWSTLNVNVEEINGVKLSETPELPILSGRSTATIKGTVADGAGVVQQDFNGIVEISLYDAEKVITTNGNGDDGVVSLYNDRKTRLFVGRAKVEAGEWSITFTMPSEIENNYSPALISLYASDESGREANGACEDLYVYGFDENVPDDFEGPTIIEFYINSPNFISGNEVAPNPVVTARFRDDSGINVSDAGIGHGLTLELDGKKYYDDVANYYVPDETDSRAGSITYSLGDVSQGNHTLRLTVWDNANNSTTATLDFKISALWKPSIETLTTDVNPATSSVNFIVGTDGSTDSMECVIEVYDIWGRKVWRGTTPTFSGIDSSTKLQWDLCDFAGAKVPGGVYLYKATVKTFNGATVTKTKKLVVR